MSNIFKRKDETEEISDDWRDLDALPKEVISKKELDGLQKEVIDELEKLQTETISKFDEISSAQPQTLYYYHKYIDAKFSKNDFNVDSYFIEKQNIIDKNYANGLVDIKSEFTGYKELINQIHEVDQRLRRKINKLDPRSNIDLDAPDTYDDSAKLLAEIELLPEEINWNNLQEKS